MLRHASLFSGIGGFDLAAAWAGWHNVFDCEINEFCRRVLQSHFNFTNKKHYHDIKTTDFTEWNGHIDILSAGFPCQPFSHAGKRRGTADERYLWPETIRAIREVRPRWVVGENVLGIVNWNAGMVFEQVCADLESEDYFVQPYIIPACGVNAPHRRYRVWFVAYAHRNGNRRKSGQEASTHDTPGTPDRDEVRQFDKSDAIRRFNDSVQTESDRFKEKYDSCKSDTHCLQEPERVENKISHQGGSSEWITNYANGELRKSWYSTSTQGRQTPDGIESTDFPRNWHEFPTESPLCRGDDGISPRLDGISFSKWRDESLKAFGNAIVPQVAYQIFKAINLYDSYSQPMKPK